MNDFTTALLLFGAATVVICLAGTRMACLADRIADRSGFGEALTGVFLLGAATSLPGLIASVTAAADGRPSMAVNNALGGIAAQTAFLVVADGIRRRANLEHVAASLANLFQSILLAVLLTIVWNAGLFPGASGWAVHPATLLLVAAFFFGQRIILALRDNPMWRPVITDETKTDQPDIENGDKPLGRMLLVFAGLGIVTGAAGWLLAWTGFVMIDQAGISESVVGALFTATASSMPELITTVAAVRHGAYTLAVSGIIGGNAFDTLFLAAADVAYTEGSIYHSMGASDHLMIGLTLLMTLVLTMGLLIRQKKGPANIGWEGILILGLYSLAVASRFM